MKNQKVLLNYAKEENECETCGKLFKTKRTLIVHSQLHLGVKFECDICEVSFGTKSNLKIHQATHFNSEKNY